MGSFTGRRPTGRAKSFLSSVVEGLEAVGTAMHDGANLERIREIDSEIRNLTQERDHLIADLYEKYEGYEVSENYDPNWSKPEPKASGAGRLTVCEGQYTDDDPFRDCHPGCPYKGTSHRKHEFTLND